MLYGALPRAVTYGAFSVPPPLRFIWRVVDTACAAATATAAEPVPLEPGEAKQWIVDPALGLFRGRDFWDQKVTTFKQEGLSIIKVSS